ncbi:hypothetical protein SBV1_1570041 [Verrucomicrobia bacterium]|nr:hypothetical protein SBV1_1570041 [Verrucomicrobiota bacterium]
MSKTAIRKLTRWRGAGLRSASSELLALVKFFIVGSWTSLPGEHHGALITLPEALAACFNTLLAPL